MVDYTTTISVNKDNLLYTLLLLYIRAGGRVVLLFKINYTFRIVRGFDLNNSNTSMARRNNPQGYIIYTSFKPREPRRYDDIGQYRVYYIIS